MASIKKPGSCRKYRDKISAHTQHQNKTETDFSIIMAEMQQLKKSAAKPKPQIAIPIQNSYQNSQGHFHGSLPNLSDHSIHMNYSNTQIGYTNSSENQKSIIQDTNSLVPPSLSRYSGGGIIRQRSVERREQFSAPPYSRSRSPSPIPAWKTNKHQPVILSHRETYRPGMSNTLQPPSNPSNRQRSHSDSRLMDVNHPSLNILPLHAPDQVVPTPSSSNFVSPQFAQQLPSYVSQSGASTAHQLYVRQKSVIVNSPGTQRRNTEADIFHIESPKNPLRKVSEPTGPKSPQIIVTFHDTDLNSKVQNPFDNAMAANIQGENRQNLYESYRVRRPSKPGTPESECGYSNHSSPGSPGITEQQSFVDLELEKKLSEFRLNNPNEFDTLEKTLFPEVNTLMSFNNTENSEIPSDNMLYDDIDHLLLETGSSSEPLAALSVCDQEVEYDGDEILKRLAYKI